MDRERLARLLHRPTESLNVETKTWIDPREAEGKAKLIKAVFALRNRNGGTFVMGFNDSTLDPDPCLLKGDLRETFHLDKIQGLVTKFASEPFEIEVDCLARGDALHPVIVIPEGVRVPVVVKTNLMASNGGGQKLLSEGDVYFRTLLANGTPSSAKIRAGDYRELLEICFENREADIGRFLRRHLGGPERNAVFGALFPSKPTPENILKTRCAALIARGDKAFEVENAERAVTQSALWMPNPPLTMRVGLCLDPSKGEVAPTQDFLRNFFSGNPNYTGWPIWLDTTRSGNPLSRPKVKGGAWQSFVLELEAHSPHSDFMLLDPCGDFYLRRVMQDDLRRPTAKDDPRLDVRLMLYRVAEVFAVGLAVARSCGWTEQSLAGFDIRWIGLAGRSLGAWANPLSWDSTSSETSHDGEAGSFTVVSLETPATAIAPCVANAVAPLFSAFEGYVAQTPLIEECVRRLLERRMD